MSTPFLGESYLECHAILENPRPVMVNSLRIGVVFDASLPTTSSDVDSNFVLASLSYHCEEGVGRFLPGMYNIRATVRRGATERVRALTCPFIEVAQFVPGIHVPSPVYRTNEIEFIGDIINVGEAPIVAPVLTSSLQLEYVHEDAYRNLQTERPAKLTMTGVVSSVDPDTDSFTVSMLQTLDNTAHRYPFVVRVMVHVTASRSFPTVALPHVNSVTVFTARLVAVEKGVAIVADEMHPFF